jgi:hypothetical protein
MLKAATEPAEGEQRTRGAPPDETTNLQVQDLIDAFRSELDARILALRSKRSVKEVLDAAIRMERRSLP